MKTHPAAEIFPLMSLQEYTNLKNDIAEHGVREPIWTFNDMVLDGRHRQRACAELGVDCPSRDWVGDGQEDDVVAFVVSVNLKRRHLNPSQVAMAAAKIVTMRQGFRSDLAAVSNLPPNGGISQKAAADQVGASLRSTQRAVEIVNKGSAQLIKDVSDGKKNVTDAVKSVRVNRPAKARKAAQKPPVVSVDTVSKAEHNRLVDDFNDLNDKYAATQDLLQTYDDVRADKSVAIIEGLKGQLRICHNRRDELMNKSAGDEKTIILLQRKLKKLEGEKK